MLEGHTSDQTHDPLFIRKEETLMIPPTLTADIVLLSTDQHVLLIKRRKWPFADAWALPGGKHNHGESLDETARRELSEETGVQGLELTQFRVYSTPERDPRGHFISTVYVAHLDANTITIQAGDDAKEAQWFPLNELPELAFDHATILSDIIREQPLLTEHFYIQEILRTYAGPDEVREKLCLGALGLAGESGEVVDQVKKFLYQGHEIDRTKMLAELGDVLWYFTLICHATGSTFREVMRGNVEKLRRRYPQGFAAERSIWREEAIQVVYPSSLEEVDVEEEHPFGRSSQ